MNAKFNAIAEVEKSYADGSGDWILEGYACTNDIDSDNDQISEQAIVGASSDLLQYSTVLFNHCRDNAIGRVLETKVNQGKLWIKVLISKTVPDIWVKIQEKILSKFSIMGDILDAKSMFVPELQRTIRVILRMSLYETSLVTIPANVKAQSLGWYVQKSMQEWESQDGNILDAIDPNEYAQLFEKGGNETLTIKKTESTENTEAIEKTKEVPADTPPIETPEVPVAEKEKSETPKTVPLKKGLDAETAIEFVAALYCDTWSELERELFENIIELLQSYLPAESKSAGKSATELIEKAKKPATETPVIVKTGKAISAANQQVISDAIAALQTLINDEVAEGDAAITDPMPMEDCKKSSDEYPDFVKTAEEKALYDQAISDATQNLIEIQEIMKDEVKQ